MQELNFQELAVEEVRLKIKTIRTRNAAEVAKLIKPRKSCAALHYIYVPKLFLVQKSTLIPAERFYSPNFVSIEVRQHLNLYFS